MSHCFGPNQIVFGKESACNGRRPSSIPLSGRSPAEKWQPTAVFLPGKSHGQRSQVGQSAWGHKESDMTKKLIVSVKLSLAYMHVNNGIKRAKKVFFCK